MVLIKENKGFSVYFNANTQTYSVYKEGKFIIGNKFKFADVKTYVE